MGPHAQDDRTRVAACMARMAEGDRAAIFELYEDFGARLAAVMRTHLAALGVRGAPREEVDGLVMDACLELFACAGGWRADGGALPWTWAAARLRGLAVGWVGLHADELDESVVDRPDEAGATGAGPWSGDEGSAYETLLEAGRHHALAALLLDGLGRVGSPRDQSIVLELRLQADLGDPSPSHTVAAGLGSSPDAVRQVSSRMRRRLRELADADERYAPLADLPLVA